MEHLIDKYLKKPEVVKDLFQKEVSISLKVDGAAFQISYDKENDSITYHKRGGSSKSLGPIIDEYTQLMRKNINDAIDYFESKKEAVKKYKFYAIEMFNDSYILLTVIDNEDNIIDDRNKLLEISKSLDIDCVPILFEGKLSSEQVESLLSMMTLEPETSNDTYKQYLTNIFGKGDYQKFLVGDEVEGIVLTWNIDNVITQYKIINPAFKTRHDKEIKQGNEDYKKEIEEYINLYEIIYETINKIGKHEDDNWIKNLDTNFINMINNEEFKSKFDSIIKTLQPKFKDFFTLQIFKASKEIQDLIKEHGDNMKFLYEKYLQVFFKAKKRNYFISKEFQLNVNKVIERLQSKNESLKLYITRMKSINNYINESNYDSSDLENLKKQLLKMNDGDRIHAVWGVRELWTDATRKDRMVDYAISIDKEKGNKYVICGVIDFPAHELFWEALRESGVEKWYHFKGWAVKLGYEDMIKVLDAMPKFFDKYSVNRKNGIWHYLSFDKKECEDECKRQIRPLTITSLEDEIKGIEQGIKDLEAKKAQLQELKKAQAEEDLFKYANSEK